MYPNSTFLDILPGDRIYGYTGPVTLRYGTHKGYCHFQGSINTVGTGNTTTLRIHFNGDPDTNIYCIPTNHLFLLTSMASITNPTRII
jgi:hypothetical protein